MSEHRSWIDRLHTTALGIWLGALILIGAGAPLVFLTLHRLEPRLPGFEAYDGPHYLIAGGQIVHRLFSICDGVQIACIILAELTFLLCARRGSRTLRRIRGTILAGLVGVLAYRLLILDPGLEPHLRDYWQAARDGNAELAASARAAYDAGHKNENTLFGVIAAGVLTALVLAVIPPAQGSHHDA
jgi:hypothetical protein